MSLKAKVKIISAQEKSGFRALAKRELKERFDKKSHYKRFSKAHLIALKDLILSATKKLRRQKNIRILGYSAFGFELDISALLIELRKRRNFRIYLPKMRSKSDPFEIIPYSLPLVKNALKIKEPKGVQRSANIAGKIDIAIVPTLCVDASLARIGYGYGSYDRTLAKSQALLIFVTPQILMCTAKISDDFDILANFVVSKEIVLKRNRKKGCRCSITRL